MGSVCSWGGASVTVTATSGCPPKRQIKSFASDLVSAWSGLYPKWLKYLSCFQVAGPSVQSINQWSKSVSAVYAPLINLPLIVCKGLSRHDQKNLESLTKSWPAPRPASTSADLF